VTQLSGPGRHVLLLIAMSAMYLGQAFVPAVGFARGVLLNSLLMVVVVSALRSVSDQPRLVLGGLAMATLSVGFGWAALVTPAVLLDVLGLGCYLVFFAGSAVAMLRSLQHSRTLWLDSLAAALCVYLLLGLCFAFGYAIIQRLDSSAFNLRVPSSAKGWGQLGELFYFSFVTLTTLGYGDVVPLSNEARTLASLEALVGQLYLAVLVSYLVGSRAERIEDRTASAGTANRATKGLPTPY